jgi:hypothetical protein
MDSKKIAFNYSRRFGAEFELNSFDNRDFYSRPLFNGELPLGMDYIANEIHSKLCFPVKIMKYHHTHNNDVWILKPDRSCGIEVCSPVVKGWSGLKSICEVADLFSKDSKIFADDKCSFHLHVDVSDCTKEEVAKILTYWIKCEPVFLDSVPSQRKRNKFCQCIGMTDLFEVNTHWDEDLIIKKLGTNKYLTMNCEHYYRDARKTIEIRITEAGACFDPFLIKNWVRLIIHFIECSKQAPIPSQYNSNDCWSGFCWLDLEDVFKFLGFMDDSELSIGIKQTRDWFLARIYKNVVSNLPGVWSEMARKITQDQALRLFTQLEIDINNIDELLIPSNPDLIYSNEYKL